MANCYNQRYKKLNVEIYRNPYIINPENFYDLNDMNIRGGGSAHLQPKTPPKEKILVRCSAIDSTK